MFSPVESAANIIAKETTRIQYRSRNVGPSSRRSALAATRTPMPILVCLDLGIELLPEEAAPPDEQHGEQDREADELDVAGTPVGGVVLGDREHEPAGDRARDAPEAAEDDDDERARRVRHGVFGLERLDR